MLKSLHLFCLFAFATTFVAPTYAASGAMNPASPAYFEAKVRPILASRCYTCHSQARMGKLRLDNAVDMMEGGSRGRVIVPGDPERSILIAAIRHTDPQLKMPMAAPKLAPAEIAALVAWVKAGAVMPTGARPSAVAIR